VINDLDGTSLRPCAGLTIDDHLGVLRVAGTLASTRFFDVPGAPFDVACAEIASRVSAVDLVVAEMLSLRGVSQNGVV